MSVFDLLAFDSLNIKRDQAEQKDKDKMTSPLMGIPSTMFGFGGVSDVFTQRQKNLDALYALQGDPTPHAAVVKGYSFGGNMETNSSEYRLGQVYEVTEKEANRLKAMGYGFTVVG